MADKSIIDSGAAAGPAQSEQPADRASSAAGLDQIVQATLGDLLRLHFDDLTREPIPGQLKLLLDELDRKQPAPPGDGKP